MKVSVCFSFLSEPSFRTLSSDKITHVRVNLCDCIHRLPSFVFMKERHLVLANKLFWFPVQ